MIHSSRVISSPSLAWPHFLGHATKHLRTFQLMHPARLKENKPVRVCSSKGDKQVTRTWNHVPENADHFSELERKPFMADRLYRHKTHYQLGFLFLYTKDASFDPNQHQQSGHLDVRGRRMERKIRLHRRLLIWLLKLCWKTYWRSPTGGSLISACNKHIKPYYCRLI